VTRGKIEKPTKNGRTTFGEPQKETPSILPWQDRGRVKIGIESNRSGGAVLRVKDN
jgi:hypothetical protein